MLAGSQRLQLVVPVISAASPCTGCPERASCVSPCASLEVLLPSRETAPLNGVVHLGWRASVESGAMLYAGSEQATPSPDDEPEPPPVEDKKLKRLARAITRITQKILGGYYPSTLTETMRLTCSEFHAGTSEGEIARLRGVSVPTVSICLKRGRLRLRESIADRLRQEHKFGYCYLEQTLDRIFAPLVVAARPRIPHPYTQEQKRIRARVLYRRRQEEIAAMPAQERDAYLAARRAAQRAGYFADRVRKVAYSRRYAAKRYNRPISTTPVRGFAPRLNQRASR